MYLREKVHIPCLSSQGLQNLPTFAAFCSTTGALRWDYRKSLNLNHFAPIWSCGLFDLEFSSLHSTTPANLTTVKIQLILQDPVKMPISLQRLFQLPLFSPFSIIRWWIYFSRHQLKLMKNVKKKVKKYTKLNPNSWLQRILLQRNMTFNKKDLEMGIYESPQLGPT